MHREAENRHLLTMTWAGELVRRTGPEQGDMSLFYLHDFIVDQVFDVTIKWHVHFDLSVPVAGGHGVRWTQFNIKTLVFRIE